MKLISQKNLAARLPEEHPTFTFHLKQLEYVKIVSVIFLRPEKKFHERYSKPWMKTIHRSKQQAKLTSAASKEKYRFL